MSMFFRYFPSQILNHHIKLNGSYVFLREKKTKMVDVFIIQPFMRARDFLV